MCRHRGPFWQYNVAESHQGKNTSVVPDSSQISTNDESCVHSLSLDHQANTVCENAQECGIQLCEFETLSTASHEFEESCISTLSLENDEIFLSENCEESRHRSYLWSRLSVEEQKEIEDGYISPAVMEEHHNVKPPKKLGVANQDLYDPMKVCILVMPIKTLN